MDIAILFVVLVALCVATLLVSVRAQPSMRPWYWVALLEYQLSALYQYYNGADANGYREVGMELSKFLDTSFAWSARELIALLIHQPSAFDLAAIGPGTNTASMCAGAAWILFFVRGSAYGAQSLIAGLSMFGAIGIYGAFQDAAPDVAKIRVFAATVLFPSIAFWVSALHKEAFCLIGMGLVLAGWRALYRRELRGLLFLPLGLLIVAMFRPPVLPPLILGLVAHFVLERSQKSGRSSAFAARPLYLLIGIGVVALGVSLVGKVSPDLALDRLSDSIAGQQGAWGQVDAGRTGAGGSAFDIDEPVERSTLSQLAHAPISLVDALFRPQLFDVTGPAVFVSAIEMSALSLLVLVVFRRHGFRGVAGRIQRSPFLLMCAIVTVVGCTFVGLTTRNFGTLARYRVPFLPFYGALLAGLAQRDAVAPRVAKAIGLATKLGRRSTRRTGTAAPA